MPSLNWERLNHLQLGKFAEYLAKMELSSYGLDIYTSEMDDHGVDFIAKVSDHVFLEFQVKSKLKAEYVFMPRSKFNIENPNMYLFLVLFKNNENPQCFIIPAFDWNEPNSLLRVRDYENLKSEPEYGLNLSNKNLQYLEKYRIENMIESFVRK